MKPENDTATSGDQENLNASQILERVAETYASAATYQDAGCVTTTFTSINGVRVTETHFTTAFVRPVRFRFEYNDNRKSSWTQEIVWRQGAKVKIVQKFIQFRSTLRTRIVTYLFILLGRIFFALMFLWYRNQPDRRLDIALGAIAGVSSVSSRSIPLLLCPDRMRGFRLTSLSEAVRTADTTYDGVKCFCVYGQHFGMTTCIAIDCVTFLVRRIEKQYTLWGGVRTEAVTTYKPIIGPTVDPRLLVFDVA